MILSFVKKKKKFKFFLVVYQILNYKKNFSKRIFHFFKKKFLKKILKEIFFLKKWKKNLEIFFL